MQFENALAAEYFSQPVLQIFFYIRAHYVFCKHVPLCAYAVHRQANTFYIVAKCIHYSVSLA